MKIMRINTKKLSQLYWLDKEIKMLQDQIYALDSKSSSVTIGHKKLRNQLELKLSECMEQKLVIQTWINNIDNSRTRLIMTYRFIDHLSWRNVAKKMGGGSTADGVRKAATRYLSRHCGCTDI